MSNVLLPVSSDCSTTLYRTPRFKRRLHWPRREFRMLGSMIIGFPFLLLPAVRLLPLSCALQANSHMPQTSTIGWYQLSLP